MSTPDTEMSLPERCTAQARSMELEGWYVCANVLNAAADRIAELEKEVERWRALLIATEHDSERRYDWWTAERDRRKAAEQRGEKLTEALEIIAGRRQCIDNLMGNRDVAEAALSNSENE